MFKRCLFFIFIATLHLYNVNSQNAFYPKENNSAGQQEKTFYHTIERGQTVYSISKMYGVSVESIYKLNPESETGIQIGNTLKIPQPKGNIIYHTILPKETLYSVSKKYKLKGEDILDANPGLSVQSFIIGRTIQIPLNKMNQDIETMKEAATNSLLFKSKESKQVDVINISILLPFGTIEKTNPANLQAKIVEYYEGILLALDSLKQSRISANLQVIDIGNDVQILSKILNADDLKSSHLIIGGITDEQIKLISDFSKKNQIPYIIPLTSKCDEAANNPYLFQINTPADYLYANAAKAFLKKYEKYNIIFIEEENNNKSDFVQTLKNDLALEKIPYKTITFSTKFRAELETMLVFDKKNVVVPLSGTKESLLKIMPTLSSLSEKPEFDLSLFGYPEWQTYETSAEISDNLYKLNTTIYSNFYVKALAPETRLIYQSFSRWYNRSINNSYPKFGLLGFDTGMFFIKAVNQFGSDFESNINKVKYRGIQTDFNFQRVNNWGGFINTNIFFVNYTPESIILKEKKQ